VISFGDNPRPLPGKKTWRTPVRMQFRPVRSAERDGEQTGLPE
jgi:hypothetical protein